MVTHLLDFHENIQFSKTLSEYQEQPYRLLDFLIHLKNACIICGIFMEQSGNIAIFDDPETLFGNITRNFIGNFLEYSGNIPWECSTNIPRTIFPEHYLKIFPGVS